MKRFTDKASETYSVFTADRSGGIFVKCPQCRGLGIVTTDPEKGAASFRCTHCGGAREKDLQTHRYRVENLCERCGRYYRVPVEEEKQQFPMLHVSCPHCGHVMAGKVQRVDGPGMRLLTEIRDGRDPYFGYELWFLAHFDGKPVWALNREHLHYLIQYLEADLREKPAGGPMKTQADQLPAFLKTAKNRERIVKLLKDMQ